jgi:hypothetical protein
MFMIIFVTAMQGGVASWMTVQCDQSGLQQLCQQTGIAVACMHTCTTSDTSKKDLCAWKLGVLHAVVADTRRFSPAGALSGLG